ncbi:hypothetical protein A2U01_0117579, partial [Trifolium medium]|nr:hypothetical protein [Trifolium medium]
ACSPSENYSELWSLSVAQARNIQVPARVLSLSLAQRA